MNERSDRIDVNRLVRLLENAAYETYKASLVHGPKASHDLFEELDNPKKGDLVMEVTTMFLKDRGTHSIGELVFRDGDSAYTIKLVFDEGQLFKWKNAKFIKVKAGYEPNRQLTETPAKLEKYDE